MNNKQRIYQIDLFRFIAALSVVLYHYLFMGYNKAVNMSVLNFSEIGDYFKYGYLGVDIFFIISGFVILLSIKNSSLIDFIIARFIRLYPAYWLCVIVTFLTIILFGYPTYTANFKVLIINITMLQGFLNIQDIDGSYWSLLIELKFYILIAFFLIINTFKKISVDYLIYFWLIFSVLYVFNSDSYFIKIANDYLVLEWSSNFIAGIIFYQIFINGLNSKNFLLLVVCLFISLDNAVLRVTPLESYYKTSFSPYIICAIISMFFILMLLVSSNRLNSINSPKLIKLGFLTYPLYLIHQNVGFIIFNNLSESINKYIILIFTILFMLLFSVLVNKKIEIPLAINIKYYLKNLTKKIDLYKTKRTE